MNLEERITLLVKLGKYLSGESGELAAVKQKAFEKNKWFTEEFITLACRNIAAGYLDAVKLRKWVDHYRIDDNIEPKKVGLVMAGNIPLVGFHDFLCVFITGHHLSIKLSEKDDILPAHIIDKLCQWNPKVAGVVKVSSLLRDCDAYIATGSNNSGRYFHYYFGKYPSLIRAGKTSVAVLSGTETGGQLRALADDVYTYFGLGCRNVTCLYVPRGYDFEPLLRAFDAYRHFSEISKYKNNYDYNLALLIMNNQFYMSNDSILLTESEQIFSPVSELHYTFYEDKNRLLEELKANGNLQCIVSAENLPFGSTQQPGLFDYADSKDTAEFLLSL